MTITQFIQQQKLRPVDSMMSDEWLNIRNYFSFSVVQASYQYDFRQVLRNRIITNSLTFNDAIQLIDNGYNPLKDQYDI